MSLFYTTTTILLLQNANEKVITIFHVFIQSSWKSNKMICFHISSDLTERQCAYNVHLDNNNVFGNDSFVDGQHVGCEGRYLYHLVAKGMTSQKFI